MDELLKLLGALVPETYKQLLNTVLNDFKKEDRTQLKNIQVCPYAGMMTNTTSTHYLCQYKLVTTQSPTRMDCYLCRKGG